MSHSANPIFPGFCENSHTMGFLFFGLGSRRCKAAICVHIHIQSNFCIIFSGRLPGDFKQLSKQFCRITLTFVTVPILIVCKKAQGVVLCKKKNPQKHYFPAACPSQK